MSHKKQSLPDLVGGHDRAVRRALDGGDVHRVEHVRDERPEDCHRSAHRASRCSVSTQNGPLHDLKCVDRSDQAPTAWSAKNTSVLLVLMTSSPFSTLTLANSLTGAQLRVIGRYGNDHVFHAVPYQHASDRCAPRQRPD